MARQARQVSKTGIYHVMLRGIDKANIFQENLDYEYFLEAINKAKKLGGFKLHGYCLMDNHIHLLVEEGEEIGNSIKRIAVSYVSWYNYKYGRVGHLFQDRFKSEIVESEEYFITALRYIHQNPVKANIVAKVEDYFWSSYNAYLDAYKAGNPVLVDTRRIINNFKSLSNFETYMNIENEDECLECTSISKVSDIILKKRIEKENNITDIMLLAQDKKNDLIKECYKSYNSSIRQLSRVFGVGKNVVERLIK